MSKKDRAKSVKALRRLCERILDEVEAEPTFVTLHELQPIALEMKKLADELGLFTPLTIKYERGTQPPHAPERLALKVLGPYESGGNCLQSYNFSVPLEAIPGHGGEIVAKRLIKTLRRWLDYLKIPSVQRGHNSRVPSKAPASKRGPKTRFDPRTDRGLYEKWKASGLKSYEEFAIAHGTSMNPLKAAEVRKAIARHKARERRKQ